MVATKLGSFTWNLGSTLQARKIGLNSESANAFETIKRSILNENGQFYIFSDGTHFDTELGDGDDFFFSGETKDVYTSGANQNIDNLEYEESGDISNDIVVYGKGINGEDIMARAVHATKFRTKIQGGRQVDFTLGDVMTSSQTTIKLSQDLAIGSWASASGDRPYIIIGHELIKINQSVYSNISANTAITVSRGQGGTVSTTHATAHADYSEVIFLGHLDSYTTSPTPDTVKNLNASYLNRKDIRAGSGLYAYFNLEVDDVHVDWPDVLGGTGDIYVGDEVLYFSALSVASDYFAIKRRGYIKSDVYRHPQGSPVTCGNYNIDTPEAGSSIEDVGTKPTKVPLDGLWSRGTADIRAEAILQVKAFNPEEISFNVGDPIGFYMDDSGATFNYAKLAGGDTDNLNIIGHGLGVTDDASNLDDETYKVVQEKFFYNQGTGPELKLTCRSIVSDDYSAATVDPLVNASEIVGARGIEEIKKSIKVEVAETSRTSDYNKKLYMTTDKSGSLTFLPGLRINDEYTFPYVDGSANQVMETDGSGILSWTDQDGGLWTDVGDYLEPETDGDGIQLNDGTDAYHMYLRYESGDSAFVLSTNYVDLRFVTGGGAILLETTSSYQIINKLGNTSTGVFYVKDSGDNSKLSVTAAGVVTINGSYAMPTGNGSNYEGLITDGSGATDWKPVRSHLTFGEASCTSDEWMEMTGDTLCQQYLGIVMCRSGAIVAGSMCFEATNVTDTGDLDIDVYVDGSPEDSMSYPVSTPAIVSLVDTGLSATFSSGDTISCEATFSSLGATIDDLIVLIEVIYS